MPAPLPEAALPPAVVDAGPPEPGACVPREGPTLDELEAMGQLEVVLESVAIMRGPRVHEGSVYFATDNDGVVRVPAAGGEPEVLVARTESSLFWIDGGFLYWSNYESTDEPSPELFRVPMEQWDATPESLGSARPGQAGQVAGDYVFGFSRTEDRLWRQHLPSGDLNDVVTASVSAYDVVDETVYYGDDTFGVEDIFSVSGAGGSPVRLSQGSHFDLSGGLSVIDERVYWADNRAMYVTDLTDADPTTSTVRLGGYGPNPDGFGNRSGWGFMERGDRVYWVDDEGNGGWTSMSRTECGLVVIADSFDTLFYGPDHLYVGVSGLGRSLVRIAL